MSLKRTKDLRDVKDGNDEKICPLGPLSFSRFFTLIEVMIAFGLVSILITTLMGFYWQMNVLQVESDQLRRESFQLRFLQSRLSEVLTRAVFPSPAPTAQDLVWDPKSKKDPKIPDAFFYVSERDEAGVLASPSLVFSYDNGKDLDPLFCGTVLGRIYCVEKEGQGQLWLATWPRPSCSINPALARRELLMPNVRRIYIECYQPPTLVETIPAPAAVPTTTSGAATPGAPAPTQEIVDMPPENSWVKFWRVGYRKLPAIIRIDVFMSPERAAKADNKLTFYFPFPNSRNPIIITE